MEDIKTIRLDETTSTNSFLREYDGEEGRIMTVAVAKHQTAGRGQGTNTWESEDGKNLLLSVLTRPDGVRASQQYIMLEACALAVAATLRHYTDLITIKWPNDVYWKDLKISGTLSECELRGSAIKRCITGTGININQTVFRCNAPNPVSLAQIIGHDVSPDKVLEEFISHYTKFYDMALKGRFDKIHAMYMQSLYRREGRFEFEDRSGRFTASIKTVEPDGHLMLQKADGNITKYAFKEVSFII